VKLDVHGAVGILTSIRDHVESLVHHSARQDALNAARHRAFIAPRLLGSFAALALVPIYLMVRGAPGALEIIGFAWLIMPILVAYFLSRTGRYEAAHVLSALALTALVTVLGISTGGIASFAAIWLVVVPLEAALSASRRVVAIASGLALAAAAILLVLSLADVLPAPTMLDHERSALAALGIISAALYAAGLALGSASLARTSLSLLTAEEDRYRLLARNMTDVITRHGRNGAVLFTSPAAEALFGAHGSELIGHGLFERVHVADRPAYLKALADAGACGEARSVEFRVRREDMQEGARPRVMFVWIEMRCRPLDHVPAASGATPVREVVAVMRDITERKAQEQAIEEAHREAEQASAAKGRFLATVSHELRTPLNAIIGFSDMLINEAAMRLDPARRKDYAQLINDSGQHLLGLVNGILDMSKIESGNFEITPEPFAPAATIVNCCDLLGLKAREAGIDFTLQLAPDLPEIVADKRAVAQILINLLSNAIKFTNRGGKVVGRAMVLTVEDSGVGIGEADLARVGDPFFQARSPYSRGHDGTGLGLSIVKGLVDLHGGRVDITSRLGEGTRVAISLPRDHATLPMIAAQPVRPAFSPSSSPLEHQVKKIA
jgi:cell cycle sensor histidine kinase DivJ